MTRIDSMVMANPNKGVIEDRKKKQGYSIKEIKTVLTRLKLLIFAYEYLKGVDRQVIYFDYPRYSVVWYIVRYLDNDLCVVLDVIYLHLQCKVPFDILDSRSANPDLFLFR